MRRMCRYGSALVVDVVHMPVHELLVQEAMRPVEPRIVHIVEHHDASKHVQDVLLAEGLLILIQ